MVCRDPDTGQFSSRHDWEFMAYGTNVDVEIEGEMVHVTVTLTCHICDKEIETDYSWNPEHP